MKIKQKIKVIVVGILMVLFTAAPLTLPASADCTPDASKGIACCGDTQTSIVSCKQDNTGDKVENNGVWGLLLMGINILTAGIGIAAVGGVIYGSILYTTAGDNDGQIKQAKEVIRNVVIGIIMYVAMYALLQFIVPGGIFS